MEGYAKVLKKEYVENGLEIEYDFSNDFEFQNNLMDSTLTNVSINGFSIMMGKGLPALPFSTEKFEIPNGVSIEDVLISEQLDTIKMECAPAALFRSEMDNLDSDIKNTISPYSGIWPQSSAILKNPCVYRDRSIGAVTLFPARYDYENHQMVLAKKIKLFLPFKENSTVVAYSGDYDLHSLPLDVFQGVAPINLQDCNQVTPLGLPMQPPTLQPTLMIITPSCFESQARKLGKWKQRVGYSVHIEVVSDQSQLLNPAYTHQLIKNRYANDKKLEYVLLLGGGDIIRPCDARYKVKMDNGICNVPTDYYFACMDGETDLLADLIIGRLPAHNIDDLTVMVDKIIQYEKYPPLDEVDFYNTGIHFSEWIDGSNKIDGRAGKEYSNFIWTSEYFKNFMEENLGTTVKRLYYNKSVSFPTYYANGKTLDTSLSSYISSSNITTTDINNAINDGAWYILTRSHGGVSQWTNLRYTDTDVKKLTNGSKLPVIFSINCNSGIIYNPDVKNSQSKYIEYSLCEEFLF